MIGNPSSTPVIAFLIVFVIAATGSTQDAASPDEIGHERELNSKYVGFLQCEVCHSQPRPDAIDKKSPEFVALTEYHNWLNKDPHSRAFLNIIPDGSTYNEVRTELMELNRKANNYAAVLAETSPEPVEILEWSASSGERSLGILTSISGATENEVAGLFRKISGERNISQGPGLLRIPGGLSEFPPKLVASVKQCLSCHAGWDNLSNDFDHRVFKYGTGVSCEACHGPATGWVEAHDEASWRTNSSQAKKTVGLYDTRQPISRSRLCFSCHIGDVEQGKVVTHAMYAAGHPPLPGIEIESYADQIPRHWRYLPEKTSKFEFASEFRTRMATDLGLENESQLKQDYPRTKNLLVNGVMASAQSVDLLADSAGEFLKLQNATAQDGTAYSTARNELNPWPEFAAFDCAACHHDLKTTGQERQFAGVPGRPPKPGWPGTLAQLGLAWLELKQPGKFLDDFAESQSGLQDALSRQPFGQPDELHNTGTKLSEFLSRAAAQIQSTPLTREDAVEILWMLCGAGKNSEFNPKKEIWDFHSARQLGWAIRLVHSEIAQPAVVGEIRLSDQFRSPESDIAAALNEMQDYLMLDLAPTGEITPLQQKFLNTWRDFDRNRFLEMIDRFSSALQDSGLADKSSPQATAR